LIRLKLSGLFLFPQFHSSQEYYISAGDLFFLLHFNFRFFLNGTGDTGERSGKDEKQGFTFVLLLMCFLMLK